MSTLLKRKQYEIINKDTMNKDIDDEQENFVSQDSMQSMRASRKYKTVRKSMLKKNLYLFTFNIASCLGWSYILFLTFPHLSGNPDYTKFESVMRKPLKIIQTMALMEIVHVSLKLVKSNLLSTTIQVMSRISVVWLIFYYRDIYQLIKGKDIKYTQQIPYGSDFDVGILGCCLSWSCVEVPRYLFYALNIYGLSPDTLTWIRYSLFTILYPTGISSELYSIWKMIKNVNPEINSITMPNTYNFEFSYKTLLQLVMVLYAPFSPYMYIHMIKQRRKTLNKLVKQKAL